MTSSIPIRINTRSAELWVRAMRLLRFVVGTDLASRWAIAGMWRLSRYRLGNGRWRSCAELRR